MAPDTAFSWHRAARLFAGGDAIARGQSVAVSGFRTIPATPSKDVLVALGGALDNSECFCVSDSPVPEGIFAQTPDFLTLTGGSSGRPKFVQRSQASWIASFAANAVQFALTPDDSAAVLGKLSHSLALYGVLEPLHLGMDAYVLDGLRPARQRTCLRDKQISVIYATPTQLRLLCTDAREQLLRDVRLILCGGGALTVPAALAILTLCPNAELRQFYGAAETSFVTITDAHTPDGSVGRAYPCVTLRVLDTDGEPTQGTGEIWVQSPYLFSGYASGSCPDTRWQDGFLSVGEIGRIDPQGFVWLKGRKTRMVGIADHNVFPEEIEAFVATQPGVSCCAVLPIDDAMRGQRLVLVLEGASDNDLADALRQACRAAFGSLVAPARVHFRDTLPLLASGKVDLPQLASWLETQT